MTLDAGSVRVGAFQKYFENLHDAFPFHPFSGKCFPKPEMMEINLDITPNSSSSQTETICKLSWEALFLSEKQQKKQSNYHQML